MSVKGQHFRKGMDIKKYQENKFWVKGDAKDFLDDKGKPLQKGKEDVKIKEQEQDKNKCSPT